MTNETVTGTPSEFFDALAEMRGIGQINRHLGNLICEMFKLNAKDAGRKTHAELDGEILKFFYLYLSLQEDGNTRFAMDTESFRQKWTAKWNSLVQLKKSENPGTVFADADNFSGIIKKGIDFVLSDESSPVIEKRKESKKSKDIADQESTKLFVLNENNLYATKYFDAKCTIESIGKEVFRKSETPTANEIKDCIDEIEKLVGYKLKERQAEAIVRGQKSNLIVTGGPGTGKTTVVLFILWKLLKSNFEEFKDWKIYLAAPSGKAADRMRESLAGNLKGIRKELIDEAHKENYEVFKKLSNLESCTIHRLLRYSIHEGGFAQNEKNKFDEKSIFVIDEASMIDINLFASFMQALPAGDAKNGEGKARVFILGDPFQLPSVDAGAVLGEILMSKRANDEFVVELNESNRFKNAPEIGKLATEIKEYATSPQVNFPDKVFAEYTSLDIPTNNTVRYASITADSPKDEEARIKQFVAEWAEFFADFPEAALKINPREISDAADSATRNLKSALWDKSLQMRLLSAERKGSRGVVNLNKLACDSIKSAFKKKKKTLPASKYFPGELLILTENQSMYKLYNGDTGIVVFDGETPYLMLKKAPPKKLNEQNSAGGESADNGDDFVFYPLAILPEDALEPAFAITIHKSQGSEYDHVTMFLPMKEGHPLLTNQILYTGVTRAKKSVTIVASAEAFRAACNTVTRRDTGIEL